MELSPTLERIAGGHIRGNDANFLEGLIEASEIFGLFGTDEAKLIAFAEQWQGKAAALEPDQSISASTNIASADEGRRDVFENARLATAERTRIEAILSDPVAQDRPKSAHHLAFNTELAADAAISLLQTIPAETAADAFDSLPEDIARACNAEGGLVRFDASAGTIAPVEAGRAPAGATLGFCPAPDPFAKADPKAAAAASWKKVTGQLNAEADHSIQA
ncbi:hypothetical protein [Brucella intermedia]|uniref:hypothetical protein n=1 Tax=Brucella intermedia TaxID=94625 RepID=UPI0004685DAF|nr:hypothetical protein [Brucella intermedia]